MPLSHLPLFHPRVVLRHLESQTVPDDLADRHERILPWVKRLRAGELDEIKEVSLHGEFLVRVFGDVLGYRGFAQTGDHGWELTAEKTVSSSGKSADGALGFFRAGGAAHVIAPIELKGAKQSLDLAIGRTLTPVQQAWEYANFSPGCRWVIVSNYRETRLYSRLRTPGEYESFFLEDLADLEAFKRFFLLCSRGQLLPATPSERAPLEDLLSASDEAQAEITSDLYREYRKLRKDLYAHLGRRHSNQPPLDLLHYTQTILDRVLFVAFAEDRGLLPPRTLAEALVRDKYQPRPVWENFVAVFGWIDQGNEGQNVPAYNGGLFRSDSDIDELELSDEMCEQLAGLSRFDFRDDVSVDVLGHIFEQSITDLEELRAEAGGDVPAKISKRKAEGVFYTPSYITRYIVEETLGRVVAEKWEAAWATESPDRERKKTARERKEIAAWERYRDSLKETRVLDPACGSGAFLLAAFDVLAREYERVNAGLAALHGGQAGLFDLTTTILNNNLFGVDLNEESVEITKLSLWLKTCARGNKLTYLARNIKCGNSIVSDPMVHPRAFDWPAGTLARSFLAPAETPEDEAIDARWRNGFDVVIGNPPYVRQELLAPFKKHLEARYRSYHGVADLYVYFFEVGLSLLKPGGRLGFISSNSWIQANYGTALRAHLRATATIETLIDLGDSRVFADAPDVRPAILIVRATKPTAPYLTNTATFSRKDGITDFARQLVDKVEKVSLEEASDRPWHVGSSSVGHLLHKLYAGGVELGGNMRVLRGVLTGLSKAFEVSDAVRAAVVQTDPACAAAIKTLRGGEHLRPWYQEDAGKWLIGIPSGWTRKTFQCDSDEAEAWKQFSDRYPAVAQHLSPFAQAARKRQDKGEFWWELRPCAYYEQFERPKIVYPDVAKFPRCSWDEDGIFLNNLCYFIPTDDKSLLAILQSRVTWFIMGKQSAQFGERAGLLFFRMFRQSIERLPIPEMKSDERAALADLATRITEAARARHDVDRKTRLRMADLVPEGKTLNQKLTEWWTLDFAALRAELQKKFKRDIALRDRDDWEGLWKERRGEHDRLTAAIVSGETEMNERIYRLFGLGAEDIRVIEEETKYRYGEV